MADIRLARSVSHTQRSSIPNRKGCFTKGTEALIAQQEDTCSQRSLAGPNLMREEASETTANLVYTSLDRITKKNIVQAFGIRWLEPEHYSYYALNNVLLDFDKLLQPGSNYNTYYYNLLWVLYIIHLHFSKGIYYHVFKCI